LKKLNIYYHEKSLGHQLYPFFSEKATRVKGLIKLLKERDLPFTSSRMATEDELLEAHDSNYVEHVKALSQKGLLSAFIANTLSPSVQWYTRVSHGSYDAALVSAGGVCQAVEDVLEGEAKRAFVIARPPGHHAGIERGEGFCLFNNIAVGALHALKKGAKKVAIIDFDRHHGNGTEEIVRAYGKENILFISSFQNECKYATKTEASDLIVPIAIPDRSDFETVKKLYEEKAVKALHVFEPELIFISAGFDMHVDDPLTNIRLESKDFFALTKMLVEVADELCEGRVISALEGGYDVEALSECVGYHLEAME